MLAILKRNPLAAAIAVIMHLAIILLMVFGLDWWEQPELKKYKPEVVQARVVDAAKVDAEVKRLKQVEKNRQEKESAARNKEIKRLKELRQKRKKEERRVADLKKKRKVQEKAEQKRKADAKRKAVAEKERKSAEAKKRKAAEAKKRKATEEKKRKALEAKKRKAAEAKKRKLAQQRKAEAEMRAAMEAEMDASELNRYRGLIQQAVTASWLRPIGIGDGLKCTLRIRMAAGGNVIAAEVVESSGSGAFDRSARAAVLKADPLPVPTGRMFERFRDINFEFAPSGGN
ncbi:MAG: cell envelope integrity protein TolA [Gammaproteobacteria bacterium]|nr:cell envelope integrity protein TolA [Gammaproteobacteria bacterium]